MNCGKLLGLLGLALGLSALPLRAQMNEDEWYDPTDWFDGNNYEYDDALGLDYGPDLLAGEESYTSDVYGYSLHYNYNIPAERSAGSLEGWHYQWLPRRDDWELDYGWHSGFYDITPETDERQPRHRASERDPASQRRTVRGTVQQVQHLNLENRDGKRDTRSVAKVEMKDGRSVLIDFGSARQEPEFQLQQGDRLVATGTTGRINGRRVLFANNARLDGQRFSMDRAESRSRSGTETISGTLEGLTRVSLENSSGEVRHFVKFILNYGRTCLTDLGRNARLPALGIQTGDRISLRGTREQIAGRTVFRADQVRVDGETIRLRERSRSQS